MALSMSMSAGAHNEKHNLNTGGYRKQLANVNYDLTPYNTVISGENIRDAYHRLFDDAIQKHNAQQVEKGHPERQINDYYKKIESAWKADQAKVKSGGKGRGNVPQPCYEYVAQIGSHETWAKELTPELATQIYRETFQIIQARTRGSIDWFQAVVHVDETDGTPHLHLAGIPYGHSPKRGLETQVSMTKALKSLGVKRLPDLQNILMECMQAVAESHGIERDYMGCDRKHLDVAEYKQLQRDTAQLVKAKEQKKEQVANLDRTIGTKTAEKAEVDRLLNEVNEQVKQARAQEQAAKDAAEAARLQANMILNRARSQAKAEKEAAQTELDALKAEKQQVIEDAETRLEGVQGEIDGIEREIAHNDEQSRRLELDCATSRQAVRDEFDAAYERNPRGLFMFLKNNEGGWVENILKALVNGFERFKNALANLCGRGITNSRGRTDTAKTAEAAAIQAAHGTATRPELGFQHFGATKKPDERPKH